VHWIRRNYLDTLVSEAMTHATGVFHTATEVPRIAVSLDPDALVRRLTLIDRTVRHYRSLLAGTACMEMYYEDFVADRATQAQRVLEFLGVDATVPLSCDLKKITHGEPRDTLANYEQVRDALRGSAYECLLSPASRTP
jgi:LPS sulfotransferase NodH